MKYCFNVYSTILNSLISCYTVRVIMGDVRNVQAMLRSYPTIEGAGVSLKRAFGFSEVPDIDPFLLLDDFHSDNPDDYILGFPWHPHRGIETVTYMIRGEVKHGDSMGNKGLINSGDIQWMTAGGGIIHQEMPQRVSGTMQGFQLWVNLPASHKMMKPRYRGIAKDQVLEIIDAEGVRIRLIAGALNNVIGPVRDLVVDIEYLDVRIPANRKFNHSVRKGHNAFAYVFGGKGFFDAKTNNQAESEHLVVFGDGDEVEIRADKKPLRFLLVSGKPIGEPVAWRGPIVMNTQKELDIAFEEYQNGTFIKENRLR